MAFSDGLAGLAKKIRDTRDSVQTEEATKNAFIMPFISNVLGYDVFDPSEVVPEFVADVGVKKGEKVDYAIFKDGQVQILMECKKIGDPLDLRYASQLFRYFAVTSARIAILTNGQQYHVYTDGALPNRMDEKPFLIFDLLDIDRTLVPEIQKFSKESFDIDSVVSAAEELKYIGGIRRIIATEVKEPSEEWVRFFVNRIYEGRTTQRILDQFRPLVAKALNQYVGDQVNSRLKTALGDDAPDPNRSTELAPSPAQVQLAVGPVVAVEPPGAVASITDLDIVTTDEELEGFNIVRAIAVSEVGPERIHHRDGKSYFAILLDNNNRKPIIRLHLNGKSVKFVTTFEAGKDGIRRDIKSVVDIYTVAAEHIRKVIRQYESGGALAVPPLGDEEGQLA
ncbi:type I restriction endonuclease [Mycobacteroides abscessus]|uniref:type I restriction endonuclease n=1 Tax=Mycobacteroides abscessus TaxID=36809 RepID=UPI00266C4AD1|nr:type I restriction enzyme HsdR N-terminal domain-containing protein [Mycobacteroides abscessus]MDO2970162.1 type I restriction enzyme HsdR N-terminal domain-containing protein [Mycobacteroides abscessus subsp. bolletii]MDO3077547.1 type I restriction enzyme HsdR N-terminal domain-containing protein [Mycobacteroides abscessus subsp. bolletii]